MRRCGNCGSGIPDEKIPETAIVRDWRDDLMCDECIAAFDWSAFFFDSLANMYTRI